MPFSSLDRVQDLWQQSPTLKLLRARHAPLILFFLHKQFKETNALALPNTQLVSYLANLLEDIRFQDEDETRLFDYTERARKYIDEWATDNYLRNYIDDTTKQVMNMLTKHTERAFQVIGLLQEREFVGTESKFRDIFHKLRDILDNTTEDPQQRIEELQRRKEQIETEISRIQQDGRVAVYDDTQIKSRFDDIRKLYNELVGDFGEVKDIFERIKRRVMEQQLQPDLSKGAVLTYAFDALDQLKNNDQGRSFYAFWHFLTDEASVHDYNQLTQQVSAIFAERQIVHDPRFWERLRATLYLTGHDVVRNNQSLADKLARVVTDRDVQERRQVRQTIRAIQQLTLQRPANAPDLGLTVDGDPQVRMPTERKLKFQDEEVRRPTHHPQNAPDEPTADDLAPLLMARRVDRRRLIRNVKSLLTERAVVTLADVTTCHPVDGGLGEILGYFGLINDSTVRGYVNDQAQESVCFDALNHKYVTIPQLTFTR